MKYLSWLAIILLIFAGVWFFWSEKAHAPIVEAPIDTTAPIPKGKISAETAQDVSQMIEVASPAQNAVVTSPLTITGKARGAWYFEASFPIELQDNAGNILAQTTGKAQSDWMTDTFVPFTATLSFPVQPAGTLGKLILKRDNPSGLPQNDMSLVIPVQF